MSEEQNVPEEAEVTVSPAPEPESDQAQDVAADDPYATLREHYAQGELTDDEIDAIADIAVEHLRNLLGFFGERHVSIDEYEGDDGELILDVTDGDLAVLIGRHGRTLDSLQMVLSSLMSSTLRFRFPVVVDIEGYKNRRKDKLRTMARSAASRAKRQRSKVSLPPMNAYERRLIHLALVDDDGVTTHSEGEDPTRHVVITALRG